MQSIERKPHTRMAVACVLGLIAGTNQASAGDLVAPQIVGGTTAAKTAWPSSVAVYGEFGTQQCGGSLISPRWVLTAAHCLYNGLPPQTTIEAIVGTNDLTPPTPSPITVVERKPHPNYRHSLNPGTYDIALVRLSQPAWRRGTGYSRSAAPIAFLNKEQSNKLLSSLPGKRVPAIITGWGVIQEPSQTPLQLQQLTNSISGIGGCDPSGLKQDSLCVTRPPKTGKGACRGDSGSPIMIDDVDPPAGESSKVLAGVTSGGPSPCGSTDFPDLFTNVGTYGEWIRDEVQRRFFLQMAGSSLVLYYRDAENAALRQVTIFTIPNNQSMPLHPGVPGFYDAHSGKMAVVIPPFVGGAGKPSQLSIRNAASLLSDTKVNAPANTHFSTPVINDRGIVYVWQISQVSGSPFSAKLMRITGSTLTDTGVALASDTRWYLAPNRISMAVHPITGAIYYIQPPTASSSESLYKWSQTTQPPDRVLAANTPQTWLGYPTFDPQGNLYLLVGYPDGAHVVKLTALPRPDRYSFSNSRDFGVVPGLDSRSTLHILGLSTSWDAFSNRLLISVPTYPRGKIAAFDPVIGTFSTVESVDASMSQGYLASPMVSDIRR